MYNLAGCSLHVSTNAGFNNRHVPEKRPAKSIMCFGHLAVYFNRETPSLVYFGLLIQPPNFEEEAAIPT